MRFHHAQTFDLEHLFTYHAPVLPDGKPDEKRIAGYQAIREAAKALAKAIVLHTPACADQSDAIRKVREATMVANAALALDGRLHHDRDHPGRIIE